MSAEINFIILTKVADNAVQGQIHECQYHGGRTKRKMLILTKLSAAPSHISIDYEPLGTAIEEKGV